MGAKYAVLGDAASRRGILKCLWCLGIVRVFFLYLHLKLLSWTAVVSGKHSHIYVWDVQTMAVCAVLKYAPHPVVACSCCKAVCHP